MTSPWCRSAESCFDDEHVVPMKSAKRVSVFPQWIGNESSKLSACFEAIPITWKRSRAIQRLQNKAPANAMVCHAYPQEMRDHLRRRRAPKGGSHATKATSLKCDRHRTRR